MTAAGVVYPVTDAALHHTSPIMIATLRALVGGAVLTVMLPLMRSRLPRTRRLWLWASAIGFGNTTLTQVGISVGTDRAGAAVAAVLLNSSPFFVALIARFALDEAITRLRVAGLVIGFGGVLLVVFSDPGNIAHGSSLAIGFALALLGALGWAGGGLGMRVLTQREPGLDIPGITAAQFLAGAVPLIPLALLAGGTTDWARGTLDLQLAYLGSVARSWSTSDSTQRSAAGRRPACTPGRSWSLRSRSSSKPSRASYQASRGRSGWRS